jgi:ubiquinone/menaquinone biosynthesis C-methylase UbiE
MQYEQKVKEVYNKRARSYEKILNKLRYVKTLKSIVETVPLEIPADSEILDLGCGTGLATSVLKQRFPDSSITGFDISEEMLKIYQERFPEIESVIGDFNRGMDLFTFPTKKNFVFENGKYDLVVSTGAVSEYGDIKLAIPVVYRVLKKDGVFVNIGIKKNVMSLVTGKLWHYKPSGRKKSILECKNCGFSEVDTLKISWNKFPSNITKFVLKARK